LIYNLLITCSPRIRIQRTPNENAETRINFASLIFPSFVPEAIQAPQDAAHQVRIRLTPSHFDLPPLRGLQLVFAHGRLNERETDTANKG
jgi:hypothetical protein